jgi:urocanate hydratase
MAKAKKTKKPSKRDVEIIFTIPQDVVITYEYGVKIKRKIFDKIKDDDVALKAYCTDNINKAVERGESSLHERQYGDYDFSYLEVDQMELPE